MDEFGILVSEDFGRFDICLKGGGGGGGGSGTVDYPAHMKEFHYQALSDNGADTVTNSMVDLLNVALVTNPYAGFVAYAGTDEMAAMDSALAKTEAQADLITESDWDSAITSVKTKLDAEVFDSTTIDNEVAAFTTILDNDLAAKTYPEFEAGMRDINAVMSSAFVIGKALIVEGRDAQIAKYDAELRHKAYLLRNDYIMKEAGELLNWYLKVYETQRNLADFTVEVAKTKVIINREGTDQGYKIAELEATWEFEAFMYAGNFLASIGGGTYVPAATKGMSTGTSALAGALGGAAMGAKLGSVIPGVGNIAGAVIGGIGGALFG